MTDWLLKSFFQVRQFRYKKKKYKSKLWKKQPVGLNELLLFLLASVLLDTQLRPPGSPWVNVCLWCQSKTQRKLPPSSLDPPSVLVKQAQYKRSPQVKGWNSLWSSLQLEGVSLRLTFPVPVWVSWWAKSYCSCCLVLKMRYFFFILFLLIDKVFQLFKQFLWLYKFPQSRVGVIKVFYSVFKKCMETSTYTHTSIVKLI